MNAEGQHHPSDDAARVRRVVDALPSAWFCFSAGGRYLAAGGDRASSGIEPADLVGRALADVVPEEVATRLLDGIAQALSTGRGQAEYRLQRGGVERLYDAVLVATSAGEVVAFVQDATERFEAQRRMAESRQRFRAVVELANEGIWMLDAAGVTTFVTARMAAIVGCDADEMVGRSPLEFMGEDGPRVFAERQARRQRGESETSAFSLRKPDGTVVHTSVAASPVHDADGRYVGSVAVVSDETHRLAVERELDETRLRLGAIAEAHDDVFYVGEIDADGGYHELFTGPGTDRLLGGTPPAAEDLGAVWDAAVHPADRDAYDEMNRALLHGEPAGAEYRLIGLDGVVRWIHDRARPRREPGRGVVFDGVITDVTARRAQADALGAALHEIRAAHTALEEAHAASELMARTDVLTGLFNRRHFGDALTAELARGERQGTLTGLVLLDVDRFKRINDTQGHDCGDQVLIEVATRLAATIRPYDVVARWGGEEFVVLVAGVPDEAALRAVGESLIAAIRAAPIASAGGGVEVTASAGAALHAPDQATGDALIDAADRALYAAKRRGRDQLVMASDLEPGDIAPEEPEALRLAEGLAIAASIREAIPPLHCQQVADLCQRTARELGVSGATVLRCQLAGWLHDIGKLAIPDHILLRAGDLDADDRSTLRRHAEIGAAIVGGLPSLSDAAPGVRHHHERYDGTGYPAALRADEIPIEARVVAACDAYSAITAGRTYQPALDHDQALEQLQRAAGRSLDPLVVAALHAVLANRRGLADAA